MKTAIVYIRGLNTHADSDWCGLRTFWQNLAKLVGADLIDLDFDDEAGIAGLDAKLAGYQVIHGAGHSHGAYALYEWLKTTKRKLAVAAFLDMAPLWQPAAWMGAPWDAPANAGKVLVFFQRNDGLLAGVRLAGPSVQEFDVTSWGLHHSTMCADERVHDRIALAILWERADAVNAAGG